ncbi:MAG TPA: chromosome segregation protein SMC, partial [Caulobacteraceae bacterium]|nr:chromosome segregation protein SMC [Caulobacteraceae bacterium]
RARDVHILFADASTGANSPALVRQGQISELIAAKPQNRRRILEEAAGVAGLHGRRHEAELRVAAAVANLERLDDLARELEANLGRLRREARQAVRYKGLAAQIRDLRAGLRRRRWLEARALAVKAEGQAEAALRALTAATIAAAAASASAAEAEALIGPRRDDHAAASAVRAALAIDKDRLDRDAERTHAEARRHAAELDRLAGDDAREAALEEEAAKSVSRLAAEIGALEREAAAAPAHLPALEASAADADAACAAAEARVEALATRLAASEAAAKARSERLAAAEVLLAGARSSLAGAAETLATLDEAAGPNVTETEQALTAARAALASARAGLDQSEGARQAAEQAEAAAQDGKRATDQALSAVAAEVQALERLTTGAGATGFAAAVDAVESAGFEAALSAALGEDLNAALDPLAPAHWAGAKLDPPAWPKGAIPLTGRIKAPKELAARIAFTALVEAADGERLRAALPPGASLVSRQGDLWRWDGFTMRADAPRPAQARLELNARLTSLRAAMAPLRTRVEESGAALAQAKGAASAARTALIRAKAEVAAAETAASAARDALDGARQDAAQRQLKIGLAAAARQRAGDDIARLDAEVAMLTGDTDQTPIDEALGRDLQAAKTAALAARAQGAAARLELERARQANADRAKRLAEVTAERVAWERRAEAARGRRAGLASARTAAQAALAEAEAAPARTRERSAQLLDAIVQAEQRRALAADALATAETAKADADRAQRAADAAAADARAERAGLEARAEAARERLAEQAQALAETAGVRVQELEAAFGADPGPPEETSAIEDRLERLERERDAAGPVNLRAEEEAVELGARVETLAAERADLAGALARLRQGVGALNAEGRTRLLDAFAIIQGHFRDLFVSLFQGGQAELRLVESDDPLEAGLEILACPPGKRMAVMSLMSGGEQALTAMALIFAVFLASPAPVCVLDEADAPLDDANIDRFCNLLAAMRARASTRFIVITHNALTMSRMDRLYGVTMREAGVSQLVSVDLRQAEALAAQ